MESRYITLDGAPPLRLHWTAWGAEGAAATVVCVHGLTRNARDFDALAGALADGARVLCVDVAGRGGSDWLGDPADYEATTYARHLATWLTALGVPDVDWVGTSMGGLIGLLLAAAEPSPIRRLVLNDVGPFVPKEALAAIGSYLVLDLVFPSQEALEAHLRAIHAPFGPLTDAQWRHLATHSARPVPEGWRLHYDPAIREPFARSAGEDIDLWALYDRVRCPTLVLRGAESALLDARTAAAMTERGPRATLVTFAGIGHAPALMAADQIAAVRSFLEL